MTHKQKGFSYFEIRSKVCKINRFWIFKTHGKVKLITTGLVQKEAGGRSA